MTVTSTYSVRIKGFNHIFESTLRAYRDAVDFFAPVAVAHWARFSTIPTAQGRLTEMERLTHKTSSHPHPEYDFDNASPAFLKFPAYLRRAAINEAVGAVSSYESNLSNWQNSDSTARGKAPKPPVSSHACPALYEGNMYRSTGDCTARVKVWRGNDWTWLDVSLRKSDVDYINRHLARAKKCSPTLQKRGGAWSLDFAFEQNVKLPDNGPERILAVDLGINSACTCVCMDKSGAVADSSFLKLPAEEDRLTHAIGHLKRAQRHGARRCPKLWAGINGINDRIAVLTAQFIINKAMECQADVIVMEHLDTGKRVKGKSKRQRLALWKAKYVLEMVTHKAHLAGIRVSTVCAWNTSKLAFDGSGEVTRGKDLPDEVKAKHGASYSLCRFQNGKLYNCDLNAAQNIGARYFIRAIQKSMPATAWQSVVLGSPQMLAFVGKRSRHVAAGAFERISARKRQ